MRSLLTAAQINYTGSTVKLFHGNSDGATK